MSRFDLMHQINARGTFMVSKWAIGYLEKAANPHILMISPPLEMKEKWFAPHTAYTMAKFGMSLVVLGLAGELRPKGIAVNALWPRTVIATAAVQNLLGGEDMIRQGRKPEIMADAAYAIFAKPSREFTGHFLIDDKFLAENGVTDFDATASMQASNWHGTSSCRMSRQRRWCTNGRGFWRPHVTYHAPLADIALALKYGASLAPAIEQGLFGDLSMEDVDAIVAEAGRFAGEVLAPLNRVGDTSARRSRMASSPPRRAGRKPTAWRLAAGMPHGAGAMGRSGVAANRQRRLHRNVAWRVHRLCQWADADDGRNRRAQRPRQRHAQEDLSGKARVRRMDGHDAAHRAASRLRRRRAAHTRADRAGDGTYRLKGQKIFITYGEHDFTDNIIHFVLARLPDAPPGTRGISLFLVPKFMLNADGSLGARNDIRAHSVEHKLGIHGSPTCTMIMGDAGGAAGFLIGEENAGMACMFTMMNRARLAVGLQGVGVAERQPSTRWPMRASAAGPRPGMKATDSAPIIAHPDVRRKLLTMRALTQAARHLLHVSAGDRPCERSADDATRKTANQQASLLTPVAKAFSTDIGNEVASLGVQVHGGMGYIEETGAAQLFRDARIAPIYEGTNGIQAIDLVTRKLPLAGGTAVAAHLDGLRGIVRELDASNDPAFGWTKYG